MGASPAIGLTGIVKRLHKAAFWDRMANSAVLSYMGPSKEGAHSNIGQKSGQSVLVSLRALVTIDRYNNHLE
jgi:hypothetical protein